FPPAVWRWLLQARGNRTPGPAQFAVSRLECTHNSPSRIYFPVVRNRRTHNHQIFIDRGRRCDLVSARPLGLGSRIFIQVHLPVRAKIRTRLPAVSIERDQPRIERPYVNAQRTAFSNLRLLVVPSPHPPPCHFPIIPLQIYAWIVFPQFLPTARVQRNHVVVRRA